MKRQIVKILEEKCDGCGLCIPNCHEGALQVIDGKARLVSDLFCDGLGACLGHCPQDAIIIEEREAEPYNEFKVMDSIVKGGTNVIKAHLEHLKSHGELEFFAQAKEYLKLNGIPLDLEVEAIPHNGGCPGSRERTIERKEVKETSSDVRSELTQWPIQMHLISPNAGFYKNSNLLLAADCVGFSFGNLHKDMIKGKSLAIACPKLDTNKQVYLDKLVTLINTAGIKSITVAIMEVPCCSGLLQLAMQAVDIAGREVPVYVKIIGIDGSILKSGLVN